jgi:hypothetical protein
VPWWFWPLLAWLPLTAILACNWRGTLPTSLQWNRDVRLARSKGRQPTPSASLPSTLTDGTVEPNGRTST